MPGMMPGSYLEPNVASSHVEDHCPLHEQGSTHDALAPFPACLRSRASWHQARLRWARALGLSAEIAKMSWKEQWGIYIPG